MEISWNFRRTAVLLPPGERASSHPKCAPCENRSPGDEPRHSGTGGEVHTMQEFHFQGPQLHPSLFIRRCGAASNHNCLTSSRICSICISQRQGRSPPLQNNCQAARKTAVETARSDLARLCGLGSPTFPGLRGHSARTVGGGRCLTAGRLRPGSI